MSAAFSSGEKKNNNWGTLGAPFGAAEIVAFGGGKKNIYIFGAPSVPQMLLNLPQDNGKVVSIAHEQTQRQTDRHTDGQTNPVAHYMYIDILTSFHGFFGNIHNNYKLM